MKRIGILALLLAPLLGGCDIALGVFFATRGGGGPDLRYHVFVKKITGGDESNQKDQLVTAGGRPGSAGWVEIGAATSSAEFALPSLATFNAILVSADVAQVYNFESLQLLNANLDVTEVASGTVYFNMIATTTENLIKGVPDGQFATTQADSSNKAFLFTIWTLGDAPTRVRINTWGAAPASGDLDQADIQTRAGVQKAGGAALKSDGSLYAMAKDDYGVRAVILYKYPSGGGTPVVNAAIEANPVTTASGNNTVVIDQNTTPNSVFLGTTYSVAGPANGRIHVMKLEGPGSTWAQTIGTQGDCRIEAHGLAIDSAGDLIVVGGVDWGALGGGLGPIARKLSQTDGSSLWLTPPGRPDATPFDLNGDYYYGVDTNVGDFWTTGTLQQTPPASAREIYVERRNGNTLFNGTLFWSDYADGPSPLQTSADRGNAVAADPTGNVYVGGFYVTTGPNQRAIILAYPGGEPPHTTTPFYVATINSPSEILDVKVDRVNSQSFIYATGYESVTINSVTRKHVFVMKIASGGSVLWKRTFNGGFGDDQGVSLVLDSAHVWVWGETTVSGGDIDVFYLRLAK